MMFKTIILVILVCSVSVVAAKTYEFVFDANSNIIDDGRRKYEYNELNQLSIVKDKEGNVIAEYFYDHEGDRIKKSTNNITTLYAGKEFVRTLNDSGITDTTYVYAGDELLAQKENGETKYYHPDHLGSTDLVTDNAGIVVEETTYYPFGLVNEGGESKYLFTGQEKDKETELMYYGARYYDPTLMRFTQPDTILQDAYDPQALNRFSYVRNNPIKNVDPEGNIFDTIADVGFVIWDVVDIVKNPKSGLNYVALGADVAAVFIPFATGAGRGVKALAKSDDVAKTAKKAGDAVSKLLRMFDEGASSKKIVKELKKVPGLKSTDILDTRLDDLPIKKVGIDKLYGHVADDPRAILSRATHQPKYNPIEVIRVGKKYMINDGVGRSVREVWKGGKKINARVLYGYDSVGKMDKYDRRYWEKLRKISSKENKRLLDRRR